MTKIELIGGAHDGTILALPTGARSAPREIQVATVHGRPTQYWWGPVDLTAPLLYVTTYRRASMSGDTINYRLVEDSLCVA